MHQQFHRARDAEEQAAADRQTASLAGVAITLLLLVIGLFLVRALHEQAAIQDCLLAGLSSCDQLPPALR